MQKNNNTYTKCYKHDHIEPIPKAFLKESNIDAFQALIKIFAS